MKKLVYALAIAAALFVPAARLTLAADHDHDHDHAAAAAAEAKEAQTTVVGEIVDLACYLGHGAKGMEHQSCAQKCLNSGQPMGLLASDGTVYLLMASHEDDKPFNTAKGFAALQVSITGPLVQASGIKALTVESVGSACGAGTDCGSCRGMIEDLIEEVTEADGLVRHDPLGRAHLVTAA